MMTMMTRNEKHTPCDVPNDDGQYSCPFSDSYMGYADEMCRVCCGLGVDEDTAHEEC